MILLRHCEYELPVGGGGRQRHPCCPSKKRNPEARRRFPRLVGFLLLKNSAMGYIGGDYFGIERVLARNLASSPSLAAYVCVSDSSPAEVVALHKDGPTASLVDYVLLSEPICPDLFPPGDGLLDEVAHPLAVVLQRPKRRLQKPGKRRTCTCRTKHNRVLFSSWSLLVVVVVIFTLGS